MNDLNDEEVAVLLTDVMERLHSIFMMSLLEGGPGG